MLKVISPLISPQLLEVLAHMGHGDEIILADAHFPAESFSKRVLRADGLRIPDLLEAIVVVMTGETAKYGNIILKKGVTPIS